MRDWERLEKKIGVKFRNKDLLRQAFVHRSYLNEHRNFELSHNERLEFLGDAVLELVVTEYLYRNYSNPEGELTNWRAALVRGERLSQIAQHLGLENYLYLSRGEAKSRGRSRQLILANTFEALIGAIYLDQGLKEAQAFLKRNLLVKLPEILKHRLYTDPKTRFQELAQEKLKITPSYKVLKEEGPEHDKIFTVGVYLKDQMVGQGKGSSKQAAESEAAAYALKHHKF